MHYDLPKPYDLKKLGEIVANFPKAHILSIGDIMLDSFLQCKVRGISPEAPVPVYHIINEKKMLGGAGNVAANLRALGCQVTFVGCIGYDDEGQEVSRLLQTTGADFFLCKSKLIQTTFKSRVIEGTRHFLRLDKESIQKLTIEQEKSVQKVLQEKLPFCDIVLVSDYGKGFLSDTLLKFIIQEAKRYKKDVFIDPKGKNYTKYAGATLIKPNCKELNDVSGITLIPEEKNFIKDVIKTAGNLIQQLGFSDIVVTLSEKGVARICRNENENFHLPTFTEPNEVVDVSGAGDTFMSVLGLATASKANLKEAVLLANFASRIVLGKSGTATLSAKELQDSLSVMSKSFLLDMKKRFLYEKS